MNKQITQATFLSKRLQDADKSQARSALVSLGSAVYATVFAFRHLALVETASPVSALILCTCVAFAVAAICFGCSRRAVSWMGHLFGRLLDVRQVSP